MRAALTATNPDACAEFERKFHTAMAEADDDFDLTRVDTVVRHWCLRAIRLDHLSPPSEAPTIQ